MSDTIRDSQRYDGAIIGGTVLALYWSLYIQPANGEILALVLGCIPITVGLYRYINPDRYMVEGLLGLLAVSLGGMTPPSILMNTRAGDWLVGSSPLPLSLGLALLVVICVLLLRRVVHSVLTPLTDTAT